MLLVSEVAAGAHVVRAVAAIERNKHIFTAMNCVPAAEVLPVKSFLGAEGVWAILGRVFLFQLSSSLQLPGFSFRRLPELKRLEKILRSLVIPSPIKRAPWPSYDSCRPPT